MLLLFMSLYGFRIGYGQQTSGSQQTGQTSRRGSSASSTSASSNADSNETVSTIDLSGRVLDARNRQPIARALVRYGSRSVLTDHDGIFHFPDVVSSSTSSSSQSLTVSRPSTTYTFTVSKPGFYASIDGDGGPQALRFASDAQVELLLYPEAILSGSVVNTAGEGLAHLSVLARRSIFDENGHHWYPAGQSQTASDGSFRLPVPAGVYSVSVTPRGRPQGGTEIILPVSVPAITSSIAEAIHLHPGEEAHLDLRPETKKAYQVSVNFDSGGGFGGFPTLTARTANGVSMPLSPTPSRGDNRNELRVALPSGSYTLLGSMQNQDGVSEAQAQVTVADHDVTGVALRFLHAPSLPVVLETDSSATSDNTKMPDAVQLGLSLQPSVDNPDSNGQQYRVESHRNAVPAFSVPYGSYRLHGLPGGQWFITAATCGGIDLLTQDLPVSPGLNGTEIRVRISNRTANLSGTVTLDGVPAAAWIYLLATTPSATPVVIVRAGGDGTFSRPYLASGSYRALALESKFGADFQSPSTQNQFLDRLQSFTVAAGEQRTLNLVAVPQRELPQ